MDSLNVFETKKIAPRAPRKSLTLTIFLAHILPGLGHAYLGKKQLGLFVFLANVFLSGATAAMDAMGQSHLWWILLRSSALVYFYAILDAALLAIEIPDGRVSSRGVRPRTAAIMNLATYGVGYWMMDRRALAAGAWVFGIVGHLWLGSLNPVFLVIAELILAASAFHAFREAKEVKVRPTLELGEKVEVERDTTPRLLVPALGSVIALSLVFLVTAASLYRIIAGSMDIDQSRSLAVEPYYKNSMYGVSMEMNAPGWSFQETAPNEFVTAYHVAENTWVRLSVLPRFPGFLKSERLAHEVVDKSILFGYQLTPREGTPVKLGKLNGYQLTAQGMYGENERREIFVLAVEKGFREYVLWFEWEPGHEEFANQELAYLLNNLQVEEQSSEGTWEFGAVDVEVAR